MCTACSIKQPQRRDKKYYCFQEPEFILGSCTTKAISNEHLNPSVLSKPDLNASLQWAEENHDGRGIQRPTAGCCPRSQVLLQLCSISWDGGEGLAAAAPLSPRWVTAGKSTGDLAGEAEC